MNAAKLIRLRRHGAPPLCFLGAPLVRHATGLDPAPWHHLAVYRVLEGGHAVEIAAYLGPTATCHATFADGLDAALTVLETHDPAQDLCGLIPAWDTPSMTLGMTLGMTPAMLRFAATLHDVARRYRIGVGALALRLGET